MNRSRGPERRRTRLENGQRAAGETASAPLEGAPPPPLVPHEKPQEAAPSARRSRKAKTVAVAVNPAALEAYAENVRTVECFARNTWAVYVPGDGYGDDPVRCDDDVQKLVVDQLMEYGEVLRSKLTVSSSSEPPKAQRIDALLELTKLIERLETGRLHFAGEQNGDYYPMEDPLLLETLRKVHASLRESTG